MFTPVATFRIRGLQAQLKAVERALVDGAYGLRLEALRLAQDKLRAELASAGMR